MILYVAVNISLDSLDLSWNCFRSRSAVALIRGIEVLHSLSLCQNVSFLLNACDRHKRGIGKNSKIFPQNISDVKSSRPSCPRGQNFVLGLEDLSLASDSASSICPRTVLELFMLASCTPLCLSSLSSFMVVFNYLLVSNAVLETLVFLKCNSHL